MRRSLVRFLHKAGELAVRAKNSRCTRPDNGVRRAIAARLACDYESWRAEMNDPGPMRDLLEREPVHGKGARDSSL
jgi:hypothetical protein